MSQTFHMPFNGAWVTFTSDTLDGWRKEGRGADADHLLSTYDAYKTNRLSRFMPHGVPWSDKARMFADGKVTFPPCKYPKEWLNDGRGFLNDWGNGISMIVGPNQTGKSFLLAAKTLIETIPCDPNWPIFAENMVTFRPWHGPKYWVIASYSWDNVATIWARIQELCPRDQLREYAIDWGINKDETTRPKELVFGDGKPKTARLPCGTRLKFLCYTQRQHHWEGFTSDGASFDEQCPEDKFTGWSRSTRTRGDYTPCFMALTGHVLEDRPDTGAAGWIKRHLWDGRNEMGRKIGRYGLSIEHAPPQVISVGKKREAYDEFVNPEYERSEKKEREGIARYWGGWEQGSGLAFDEWDPNIHIIAPLWADDKVPRHLPKIRIIDHSQKKPTACAWFAVLPTGDYVMYRNYYEPDMVIAQHVPRIIEASHNQRVQQSDHYDEITGNTLKSWEEDERGEQYVTTQLDPRSCAHEQQNETLLDIYIRNGITRMEPANGQHDTIQVPRLRELLAVDFDKPHMVTGQSGAPRLYVFECCHAFIDEIEELQVDPRDRDRIAKKVNGKSQEDHMIDTAKWFASEDMVYFDATPSEEDEVQRAEYATAPHTGY